MSFAFVVMRTMVDTKERGKQGQAGGKQNGTCDACVK